MDEANFDIAHELDEFLLVERPLTHSKRKVNPDWEKMKPELRQLENEYVLHSTIKLGVDNECHRFTVYDHSKSRRLSYYPHNQPVGSSERSEQTLVQSVNGTVIPNATVLERSQAGSPSSESDEFRISPHSTSWTSDHSQ
jgi:serine/threonine kinase 32